MKITSTQNPLIKDLIKLSQKKYRDKTNSLLIEGDHLIEEAQKAGLLIQTLGTDEDDVEISDLVSKRLSTTKSGSQRFAHIRKPEFKLENGKRFLVLDGVQDPGNVGTCIRTAYSFGFDAVILSLDSADMYNDKVVRATQGALFHIPCLRLDLKDAYTFFKDNNITLFATHVDDKSVVLDEVEENQKLAVVMGSEGQGISDLTLKHSDHTLHIETSHFESLNVAVAASIICYKLRQ